MLNSVQIRMGYNYICSVPYEKVTSSFLSDQSAIKKISFIALAVIAAFSFAYVLYRHYFSHRAVNQKQEGDLSSKIKDIPQNQTQERMEKLVNETEKEKQAVVEAKEEDKPGSKENLDDCLIMEQKEEKPDFKENLDDCLIMETEIEAENGEEEPDSLDDLPKANVEPLEAHLPLDEEQILVAPQSESVKQEQKPDPKDHLEDLLEIEPENVIPEAIVEPPQEESPLPLDKVKEMLSKRGKLQSVEGTFYLRNQKIEGEGVKIEFLKPLFCVIEGRIQEGQLVEGKIRYKGPVYGNPAVGLHQWEEHDGHFVEGRLAKGTIILSNGTIYSGTFSTEENYPVLEGKGKIMYPWEAIYKGDFVKGELSKGTMTFPGDVIYEGEFADDVLVKGAITLPSGYKKVGGYNQKGLFEGTLVYLDKEGRQWQREIKEGRISAERTQLNPPEDQPLGQDIPDDRLVGIGDPGHTAELIGEFTNKEGNLVGQGVVILKYKSHIKVLEGIIENAELIKGKTTYYKMDEETEKIYAAFEFDGTYVDKCQGRYVEWRHHEGEVTTEMREGQFSLEDLDFFTKLEGMARTKSPEGDRQEGLFKENRLQQGREIKGDGTKNEGYFREGQFNDGQIFYDDGRIWRGKMTSCVVEEFDKSALEAYHTAIVRPMKRTMQQRFQGIQILADKKGVKKVIEGIPRGDVKSYKCAFIDF